MASRITARLSIMVAGLSLFLLTGCATPPAVVILGTKRGDYQSAAPRILVVQRILVIGPKQIDEFQKTLAEEFARCGVKHEIAIRTNPRATLDLNPPPELIFDADKVKALNPDSTLSIIQSSVAFSTGGLDRVIYQASFVDNAMQKTIWTASILQQHSFRIAGSLLATELVAKLAKDGILSSCPVKS